MAQTLNYTITTTEAGSSLSWSVTGANLGAIYTGPTQGSVTANGNGEATLTFNLTDNNTYNTAYFTLTVTGGACDTVTDTVVVGGQTQPPPGPEDPVNWVTVCDSVAVPVIYCPIFDGNGTLVGVHVEKTARFKLAPVGGIPVPSSVGVSGGSIVVNSTVNIDPAAVSGVDIAVITTFDGLTPTQSDPLITGTTTTVKGWF